MPTFSNTCEIQTIYFLPQTHWVDFPGFLISFLRTYILLSQVQHEACRLILWLVSLFGVWVLNIEFEGCVGSQILEIARSPDLHTGSAIELHRNFNLEAKRSKEQTFDTGHFRPGIKKYCGPSKIRYFDANSSQTPFKNPPF